MEKALTSIVAAEIPCKVCGAKAEIFGVVDFHQHCNPANPHAFKPSGIPIYYHKCTACGFLFTPAMDHFTEHDFLDFVYNDQYALVDPDYREVRPRATADIISQTFSNAKQIRILDYGGGNGSAARLLRERGYLHVEVYDPFVKEFASLPTGKFDLILCLEVMEHTATPMKTFREISSLLESPGLLVFSTLLRIPEVENQGLHWWYVGPRNGHISIYSPTAMAHMVAACGMKVVSASQNLHFAFTQYPDFARHLLAK